MSGNTGVLEGQTRRVATAKLPNQRVKHETGATRPVAGERLKNLEAKAFREAKSIPGVSVFAIIGTLVVSFLMVLVVLAQINYNETAGESVRLKSQLRDLEQQHKALEFAFETGFDIKEIERIATDELGMSRPDAAQVLTITAVPHDSAIVIIGDDEEAGQGFTDFIRSLFDYFR